MTDGLTEDVASVAGVRRPLAGWAGALLLLSILLVGAFTVSTLPGVRTRQGYDFWLDSVLGNAAQLVPCLLAAVRAGRAGRDRSAWLLLVAALTVYEAGSLYWAVVVRPLDPQPFPSVADGLWLASYPLMYACLYQLLRRQLRTVGVSAWLDGVICGLGAATVTGAFLVGPVLDTVGGSASADAVNLAYPIGDLLLVAFIVASVALLGWRPSRSAMLLACGFLLFAFVDVIYLVQVAHGTYVQGRWVDALWPIGFVVMAAASGHPPTRHDPAADPSSGSGRAALAVPVLWAQPGRDG